MLPPEIIGEFYPQGVDDAVRLSGGQVNTTYRVADNKGMFTILQKMGPSSDPLMAEDYWIVAERLKGDGWEVAEPILTENEELTALDDNESRWRGYTFIPSDPIPEKSNVLTQIGFGHMVGRLSLSLARLDRRCRPKFSIPHFHDPQHTTGLFTEKLLSMAEQDQGFGLMLLAGMASESPIGGEPQFIHGDPKLTNGLFRDCLPFTMIDWDNLMHGSPMLDLADMLRSMTGQQRDYNPNFSATDLLPIIRAYRHGANIEDKSTPELFEEALSATRVMALMLAMRYLNDTIDRNYFQWDPNQFPDAAAHNRFRARRQWDNYQALLI